MSQDQPPQLKLAKSIHLESQLKKLSLEVEKLMNIASQHGLKIKELTQHAANSVSQVEFMSAITTTRFQALNVAKSMKVEEKTSNNIVDTHDRDDKENYEMKQIKNTLQHLENEQNSMTFRSNMETKRLEHEMRISKKEFQDIKSYISQLETKLEQFVGAVEEAGIATNITFAEEKNQLENSMETSSTANNSFLVTDNLKETNESFEESSSIIDPDSFPVNNSPLHNRRISKAPAPVFTDEIHDHELSNSSAVTQQQQKGRTFTRFQAQHQENFRVLDGLSSAGAGGGGGGEKNINPADFSLLQQSTYANQQQPVQARLSIRHPHRLSVSKNSVNIPPEQTEGSPTVAEESTTVVTTTRKQSFVVKNTNQPTIINQITQTVEVDVGAIVKEVIGKLNYIQLTEQQAKITTDDIFNSVIGEFDAIAKSKRKEIEKSKEEEMIENTKEIQTETVFISEKEPPSNKKLPFELSNYEESDELFGKKANPSRRLSMAEEMLSSGKREGGKFFFAKTPKLPSATDLVSNQQKGTITPFSTRNSDVNNNINSNNNNNNNVNSVERSSRKASQDPFEELNALNNQVDFTSFVNDSNNNNIYNINQSLDLGSVDLADQQQTMMRKEVGGILQSQQSKQERLQSQQSSRNVISNNNNINNNNINNQLQLQNPQRDIRVPMPFASLEEHSVYSIESSNGNPEQLAIGDVFIERISLIEPIAWEELDFNSSIPTSPVFEEEGKIIEEEEQQQETNYSNNNNSNNNNNNINKVSSQQSIPFDAISQEFPNHHHYSSETSNNNIQQSRPTTGYFTDELRSTNPTQPSTPFHPVDHHQQYPLLNHPRVSSANNNNNINNNNNNNNNNYPAVMDFPHSSGPSSQPFTNPSSASKNNNPLPLLPNSKYQFWTKEELRKHPMTVYLLQELQDMNRKKLTKLLEQLNSRLSLIDKHTIYLTNQFNYLSQKLDYLIVQYQSSQQFNQKIIHTCKGLYDCYNEVSSVNEEIVQPIHLLLNNQKEQLYHFDANLRQLSQTCDHLYTQFHEHIDHHPKGGGGGFRNLQSPASGGSPRNKEELSIIKFLNAQEGGAGDHQLVESEPQTKKTKQKNDSPNTKSKKPVEFVDDDMFLYETNENMVFYNLEHLNEEIKRLSLLCQDSKHQQEILQQQYDTLNTKLTPAKNPILLSGRRKLVNKKEKEAEVANNNEEEEKSTAMNKEILMKYLNEIHFQDKNEMPNFLKEYSQEMDVMKKTVQICFHLLENQ
jgi:hypothetical protein